MPENSDAVPAAQNEPASSPARIARRALLGVGGAAIITAACTGIARAAPDGERKLALYNPNTGEHFDDVFWCDGRYVPGSLKRVDWLMRDFHQDKVAIIDPELINLLHRIGLRLGTRRPFHILSGYRTPATNRLLRREGWGAAEHSEHLVAKAADICLEGVSLKHLRHAALSLKAGGVGTYWRDSFVHVDVGPMRSW